MSKLFSVRFTCCRPGHDKDLQHKESISAIAAISKQCQGKCTMQAWCGIFDVQLHKLRAFAKKVESLQSSALEEASDPEAASSSMHLSCGLITTAAVHPGDVLLSIPSHVVVTLHQPQQTIISLACLLLHQPPGWQEDWVSGKASTATAEAFKEAGRQTGGLASKRQQDSAEAESAGNNRLHRLAEFWLSVGAVKVTLPVRLLLAQLWPDHAAKQAPEMAAALAGRCTITSVSSEVGSHSNGMAQTIQCCYMACDLMLSATFSHWGGVVLVFCVQSEM